MQKSENHLVVAQPICFFYFCMIYSRKYPFNSGGWVVDDHRSDIIKIDDFKTYVIHPLFDSMHYIPTFCWIFTVHIVHLFSLVSSILCPVPIYLQLRSQILIQIDNRQNVLVYNSALVSKIFVLSTVHQET